MIFRFKKICGSEEEMSKLKTKMGDIKWRTRHSPPYRFGNVESYCQRGLSQQMRWKKGWTSAQLQTSVWPNVSEMKTERGELEYRLLINGV